MFNLSVLLEDSARKYPERDALVLTQIAPHRPATPAADGVGRSPSITPRSLQRNTRNVRVHPRSRDCPVIG